MKIKELLKTKILVLDGAMGTMVQRYNLKEGDYYERYEICHFTR